MLDRDHNIFETRLDLTQRSEGGEQQLLILVCVLNESYCSDNRKGQRMRYAARVSLYSYNFIVIFVVIVITLMHL